MMDRHFALGLQQDLYNDAERYLDKAPSFPPEDCSIDDCHRKLSEEDVDTAAMLANAYLGLGCTEGAEDGLKALLRAYYLDTAKRAMIVEQ